MSPQDPVVLTIPPRRWGPREQFALEGDVLVRLTGRRQTRWPLARLRRFTLGVRRSPYAKPLRFVRLRFAGQNQTIVCGPEATDYAIFVCALARAAAHAAPDVRFQAEGGRLAGLLVMSAALLGAGAVAMALAAVMAGLAPLGLDLAARLSFLLILVFAVTPWISRAAPAALDPQALPRALLNGT
jgi:hypothetical protein